jgi:hypothetical protein
LQTLLFRHDRGHFVRQDNVSIQWARIWQGW